MEYKVENQECQVFVNRKNNKNTYIRVKEDMNIYVTTNYFVTNKQIINLLDKNYDYLVKSLNRQELHQKRNELFYYLGEVYDIIIIGTKDIEFIDHRIYVKSKDYLDKWYKKEIKRIFKERMDIIYNQFEEDIPYPNLRIRTMKTRWGVCNRKTTTVTLNSELIKYDISKIDYVIIHELSHFIHFNHSANFWNLVSKYCPNYKLIRKELRY